MLSLRTRLVIVRLSRKDSLSIYIILIVSFTCDMYINLYALGHTKLMLCFTDYLPSQSDPAGREKINYIKTNFHGSK